MKEEAEEPVREDVMIEAEVGVMWLWALNKNSHQAKNMAASRKWQDKETGSSLEFLGGEKSPADTDFSPVSPNSWLSISRTVRLYICIDSVCANF